MMSANAICKCQTSGVTVKCNEFYTKSNLVDIPCSGTVTKIMFMLNGINYVPPTSMKRYFPSLKSIQSFKPKVCTRKESWCDDGIRVKGSDKCLIRNKVNDEMSDNKYDDGYDELKRVVMSIGSLGGIAFIVGMAYAIKKLYTKIKERRIQVNDEPIDLPTFSGITSTPLM